MQSGAAAVLLLPPFAELLSGSGLFEELGVAAAAIATGTAMPDMATVRVDNRAAMAAMTVHVARQGIAASAFLRARSISPSRRAAGGVSRRAGGEGDCVRLVAGRACRVRSGGGAAAGRALLDLPDRPSAILCSSDDMAAGLIGEAQRMGLRLPDDLAVTGSTIPRSRRGSGRR